MSRLEGPTRFFCWKGYRPQSKNKKKKTRSRTFVTTESHGYKDGHRVGFLAHTYVHTRLYILKQWNVDNVPPVIQLLGGYSCCRQKPIIRGVKIKVRLAIIYR